MTPEPHGFPDLILFLATAAVVVPLFARLRLSPVLGFLAAGVLLGPSGLGLLVDHYPWVSVFTFTNPDRIAQFGEFGVAFLLFMIGLELSWDRLMRMRRFVFGLGPLQVGASAAALAGAAFAFGEDAASALVLGTALALSSTAIVLSSLSERKRLNSAAGRMSFAILLFQDLAVAPLLLMIALLGVMHGSGTHLAALYAFASALAVLAILVGLGRIVLRPLFHLVAETKSDELFVAACLLVVIATGTMTAMSGQSMALGAFIAGLLLAETEYRRQIEVTVAPFEGLFLGLFFISVGAGLDLSQVMAAPLLILGLTAGVIALKMIILLPVARLSGLPRQMGRELAMVLAPSGEFALVAIGAATAAEVVSPQAGAIALIVATLSMFTIPFLVRLSERLQPETATHELETWALIPHEEEETPRVLLVGYGRVGQLVGQMLTRHNIPFLAIDSDAELVARERKHGITIYYGDATRIELLRLCGIAVARAVVVTMDASAAVEAVVTSARAERADLTIVARARDAQHAAKLYGLGVTDSVPETIEASLQLSEAVLVDIGVAMGPVIASIHEKREEFRKMLQAPSEEGRRRHAVRASTRHTEEP